MTEAHDSRFHLYLQRILEAALLATSYVERLSKEDFLDDSKTRDAVCMNIIVIGENASKLLAKYKAELDACYPDIPWTGMAGMRHRMAHGYEQTDFELVWDTLQTDIPRLAASLREKGV